MLGLKNSQLQTTFPVVYRESKLQTLVQQKIAAETSDLHLLAFDSITTHLVCSRTISIQIRESNKRNSFPLNAFTKSIKLVIQSEIIFYSKKILSNNSLINLKESIFINPLET